MYLRVSLAALAVAMPVAAAAEGTAGDLVEGDPILVTGERIARTVEETASSVDVTTGEELRDRAGADTVNAVLALAPNVSLAGAQNNGPTIRGQNTTGTLSGVNAFLGGSRPRTTILLDGRPLSFNEFIFSETGVWDIEQIEVFLGPQTTTQGPNSVAGLINVRTADPTYETEGAARAIIASYDTYQLSGMVNVPLAADQLALRVAADWRDHRTFVALPDIPIGVDPEEDSFTTLRAKLLAEPEALPGFRALLTYSFTESLGPQVENIRVPPPGVEERIHPGFEPVSFGSKTHAFIADLSQQVGERLMLGNRFTYADARINRYSPPGLGVADIDREEFTNETLLTYGAAGDAASGVAGIYYQEFSADELIDLAAFGLGDGAFTDEVSGLGVFGEATVSPADRLFLTAGLRYQRDRQDRNGGFTAGFLTPIEFDRSFEAFLPKFGMAYDIGEDWRIGAQAQRGYNPGGVTLSFFTGEVDLFEEERLWSYELYWRGNLLGDTLTLNGNLFYTDFEDAQRPVNVVTPNGIITELSNAEDAQSYGAEVQLSYAPTERLAFDFGLGLLETEIERVTQEPVLEGNEFERAPGVTASLAARVEPVDGLVISAQGRYSSDYFSDDANTPMLRVGDYFLANAQVAYEWGPVRLFAFATNVFDEFVILQQFDATTANVNDPREYGAGIEVRFR